MKIEKHSRDNLDSVMCMSNLRGSKISRPHKLPFSFYFSANIEGIHSIRVKPIFNPSRFVYSEAGSLKLCDDWEYVPGKNDTNIKSKEITAMKEFFRTYLILFTAVWDEQLSETAVQDYLEGDIDLDELVKDFSFYPEHSSELDQISTIEELEQYCRDHDLVNLYGN